MKKKKGILGILSVGILGLIIITCVKAEDPNVIMVETEDCTYNMIDNGIHGGKRDVLLNVNNVKGGRRINKILYCLDSSDCENDENWIDIETDEVNKKVTAFQNSVGTNDMTFFIELPTGKLNLKAEFVDYEPMDITYSNYTLTPDEEHEFGYVYNDGTKNLNNYSETYNNLVTGYKGGDIILPEDCTSNGCILKVTLSATDFDAIQARVTEYNEEINDDMDDILLLELSAMFNHLEDMDIPVDTIYPYEVEGNLYIENGENTKSFYLIINKFFTKKNRSDFILGDNKNRILSEDYIGIKYLVDRKYFDETDGFLSFTEENNYTQDATLFYGAPKVQLLVESAKEVYATNTEGMGTLKHPYNKIVSKDNAKYPINESFELTINSFYEPEYRVPLVLKNNDTTVQEVTLNLNRFAFGGNGGGLLVVDSEGHNCRNPRENQNCGEANYYISTEYRGLVDTFYTRKDVQPTTIDFFAISNQEQGLIGDSRTNQTVYARNEEFNPWAVAIFYHDDMVVTTRSFNLGELVKTEGITRDTIENDMINGIAKDWGGQTITDYNSADYTYFGYGLGYEKSINSIKYFNENDYERGTINYTLILASKEEIIDNDITRIALFLTNGELKSDEENFPELTYGVGEGKVFEVDNRTFDRLGGNN